MSATKKYKAATIARWFISKPDRDAGDTITHLKLQKLLYYAQAWHLVHTGERLFDDEMQAWTHGPVVPSVWQLYRDRRWDPLEPEKTPKLDEQLSGFLEKVWAAYGGFSAKRLEKMTHDEKPWIEARGNLPLEAKCTTSINEDTIVEFYKARLEKNAA